MSLLNLTNDGLPNVLVVLYAAVAHSKSPISAQELIATVAPPDVDGLDEKMARQTLNRWTSLGLFVGDDSGISLANKPGVLPRDDLSLIATVRREARRCALSDTNNQDIWAKEGARSADLTRALAWVLAQDVYSTSFADLEQLEISQIVNADYRPIQNDTRKNGLKYWGYFLGFVRQPEGGDIDPTVALRESLPLCMDPGESLAADDFIARVADILPVLDRGKWRKEVEDRLNQQSLPTLEPGQMSTSLSRALLNLVMENELQLLKRADAGSSIVLTGRNGLRPDHRYQWVSRPSGSKVS